MRTEDKPNVQVTVDQLAALAAFPVFCFLVGAAFLPHPQMNDDGNVETPRTKQPRCVLEDAPDPTEKRRGLFGDTIEIVGATLPTNPVAIGSAFSVTTFLRAVKPIDRDWQIFMHIDGDNGGFRIHADHFPCGGRHKTTMWAPESYVADLYSDDVPRDAPPGRYRVYIGFYQGEERLPFSGGDSEFHDGENRFLLGTFEVK